MLLEKVNEDVCCCQLFVYSCESFFFSFVFVFVSHFVGASLSRGPLCETSKRKVGNLPLSLS